MKKEFQNEDLQSRREFFKNAAKGALPILAFTVLGSTFLTACEKDDNESSGCGKSCSGSCDSGCSNNCDGLCGGDCWHVCESKSRS